MKLLLISHAFAPSIGGIESVSDTIAREWVHLGHEVTIVTQTKAAPGQADIYPFRVVRRPSPFALLYWHVWADAVVHNNISLRLGWPLHLIKRPWVVVHQTHLRRPDGTLDRADHAKRKALTRARSVAISNYIARDLPVPARIIGNPYRTDIFSVTITPAARPHDFIFVGRLVSDKGVDLLLEALATMRDRPWSLLITGSGPEEAMLRHRTEYLGMKDRITFTGPLRGVALSEAMNQARIMVVPSRWPEPFGVVALEGIASGCFVVGSADGGLPEAIGPCGLTFKNNDAEDLVEKLTRALDDMRLCDQARAAAPEHLRHFTPSAIAKAWLQEIAAARNPS